MNFISFRIVQKLPSTLAFSLFLSFCYAQSTEQMPLAGQWRIDMDIFQDGKITGDGNDMPAANCLLTIKDQGNGRFEGRFSSSSLVNKSTIRANKNEEQVEYLSECPVKDQTLQGQVYGKMVVNALQIDNGNIQKKSVFNGKIVNENEIKGAFYGTDCFLGDFAWHRVGTEEKTVRLNRSAAALTPVTYRTPVKADLPLARPIAKAVVSESVSNEIKETKRIENPKLQQKAQFLATKTDKKATKPLLPRVIPVTVTEVKKDSNGLKKAYKTQGVTQIAAKKAISTPVAIQTVFHKVNKGETLYRIAQNYKTTVAKLNALNHFTAQNTIAKVGQSIKIR